jgi:hypothetical protein
VFQHVFLFLCHVFLIMITPSFFCVKYPAFQERKGTGMRVMCVCVCMHAHMYVCSDAILSLKMCPLLITVILRNVDYLLRFWKIYDSPCKKLGMFTYPAPEVIREL